MAPARVARCHSSDTAIFVGNVSVVATKTVCFLKPNGPFPAACCLAGALLSACPGTNLPWTASSAVSHKIVEPYRVPKHVVTARHRYCAPFLTLENDVGATPGDRPPDLEPSDPTVATTRVGVSGQSDARRGNSLPATALNVEAVSTAQLRDVLVDSDSRTGGAEQSSSSVGGITTSLSDPEPSSLDDGSDEVTEEPTHSSEGVHHDSPSCPGRVKVGFLSAFFFHHSVGLLTEGVITRLDRRRFETTAIFLQPHPTSATEETTRGRGDGSGDDVYTAVRRGTENVLDLPASR